MIDTEFVTNYIKNVRLNLNLTQAEFGKLLGISKQSICAWEKGRNLPDIVNLLKIVDMSGKDLSQFMKDNSSINKTEETKLLLSQNEKELIYKLRSLPLKQQQAIETIIRSM
ncbi:MAG: helix-turn-helix domain-containing protein [Phascolarctobacterium sp.]|nr:helix-turn-helix domain-containing protein [Candidatus Phascolarctobacterium equi]